MKISNINPYINTKTISKVNHTKPISFTSIQKPQESTVSGFKKLALQLEAKNLERQSRKIIENSKEAISYAIDKQEFSADKVKQSQDIQETARIAYYSAMADFREFNISDFSAIDEKTGKAISEITIENPTKHIKKRTLEKAHDAFIMTDYRENGTRRELLVKKNITSIREYGATKGKAKIYTFDDNGNLLAFARNPQFKNGAYTMEERFKYNKGYLSSWETYVVVIQDENIEKAYEKAEFKNGELSGFSKDWTKTDDYLIRAKEYYTFKDGVLHAKLNDYRSTIYEKDGFSASSILSIASDKKVSYCAKDAHLTIDALGYFGKYFEFGKNNNLRYTQVEADTQEDGMTAKKIFKANKDGKLTKCYIDATLDNLNQITSKKEIEL